MKPRTCSRCVYATDRPGQRMINKMLGWPVVIHCVNWKDAPGQLTLVFPTGTCRNFRARREPPVWTELPYPTNDEFRHIALTQGYLALVDADDFEWLNQYKWTALVTGGNVYAIRNEKGKVILMHREIMQPPKGMVVDHIDGHGWNNLRLNLRTCTRRQNLCNTRPRGGRSQYKGVRYEKRREKWIAEITHKGKKHYLGAFDDEIEAAKAYDRKAVELFGEFARLNFP